MKMIVGLGNPGKEYEKTRHNVGFMVLNYFPGNNFDQEKFNANYYKTKIYNEDVIFVKPLTYMNLSGEAVSKFANYYKIDPKDILIIHDDLDLPVGTLRLKYKSSSGGHNGIKSIIQYLGTDEIPRLKVGISNDKQMLTKDYVLHKFSKEELNIIEEKFPLIKEIIEYFVKSDIIECMSRFNLK